MKRSMERASVDYFQKRLKQKHFFVFTASDIIRIFGWSETAVRFLLHRYTKRGITTRLKRGLYKLSDVSVPEFYIANRLYEPSYISLETALSFHGVIPETVYALTSVSTKTSRKFQVLNREFYYHKIKPNAFVGYDPLKIGEFTVLMATQEKSLVDYCWFVVRGVRKPLDQDRLRLSHLKWSMVIKYARHFKSEKLIEYLYSVFGYDY